MKKKMMFGFAALMLAAMVMGCDGSQALVGKWVPEDGPSAPSGWPDKMELFKDGTGIGDQMTFTWKAEQGRLVVKADMGMGFAYNYTLSGQTLVLTDDDGESVRYRKKQ